MTHTLYLVPGGSSVGLTSVALGLVRALDNRGVRVAFFKPIGQHAADDSGPERSTYFVRHTSNLTPATSLPVEEAEKLIAQGRTDQLLDHVMRGYHTTAKDADVVVVEGLIDSQETTGEGELNRELVRTLSAEVIVVASPGSGSLEELEARVDWTASRYGGFQPGKVIATIVNRVPTAGERISQYPGARPMLRLSRPDFNVIGAIPENPELLACRTVDLARHLNAEILHAGEINLRRVRNMTLLARTMPNVVEYMTAGALLVTPADRLDIIVLVALAAANKIPISGLILTGDFEVPARIMELCRPGLESGLPLLRVKSDSYDTATALARMSGEVPIDDLDRAQRATDFVAAHLDADWIAKHSQVPLEARMSPAAFCFRLTELARSLGKRIVLPEGDEPRTLRAASICAERGIARCVLLGAPAEIHRVAAANGIELLPSIEILDPNEVRARYVAPLVEMRKHKGLKPRDAAELLEDNVWIGTVMLALGEVDGLVSGAVHSTANTIRPALQIVKTKPNAKVVSSVFFMCLPEQVVVYGDCAVIPDPDAETLADIALQSADSAKSFGIEPRVAMISYSTGESGSGSDVEKVRAATLLAQKQRPELALDGPLQYDAATVPEVAATKAPNSNVAGKATVFIFPDLNTGNTTYKAVQRSANVISIGPMLQGMRRPVNDLSRGALVDDIVYTIAITAIQADSSANT
jgi:phosphate acetyltransferase